jgi:hypothetical protein
LATIKYDATEIQQLFTAQLPQYKKETEELSPIEIADTFVGRNDNRRRISVPSPMSISEDTIQYNKSERIANFG